MITGLLDHLQQHNPGSTLYGIQGGPKGIMDGIYKILGPEEVAPFRNQVRHQLAHIQQVRAAATGFKLGQEHCPFAPGAQQLEEADADF